MEQGVPQLPAAAHRHRAALWTDCQRTCSLQLCGGSRAADRTGILCSQPNRPGPCLGPRGRYEAGGFALIE